MLIFIELYLIMLDHSLVSVWWYQRLCNAILTSWWWTHVLETCRGRCDDTRGCVMQFWPPDDEHMCSKHVEAWNKLIVKQKFCASSWLISEINILRCTVRKIVLFVNFNLTILHFTFDITFIYNSQYILISCSTRSGAV